MKWLITGGCGFLGTSLIKNLQEEGGHFVRVVDNLSVGSREDLAKVCQFTEASSSSLPLFNPQSAIRNPQSMTRNRKKLSNYPSKGWK